MTNNRRVFCQIVGKDITVFNCQQTQGQEDCFGCAAFSRLCELCQEEAVDVPAIGMCSVCLTFEVKKEEQKEKPRLKPGQRVECQIAKKEISVQTCYTMQGQEGCRNCQSSSRLCEECQKRPWRFYQYGLCLICAVKKFGEGWQPITIPDDFKKDVKNKLLTKGDRSMVTLEAKRQTKVLDSSQIDLCVKCKKQPIHNKLRSLCKPCVQRFYNKGLYKRLPQGKKIKIDNLLPIARNLILWVGITKRSFLQEHFHISSQEATLILKRLEKEGIVGPYIRGRPRQLLIPLKTSVIGNNSQTKKVQPENFTLQQKIKKIEQLIKVIGEDSEFAQLLESILVDLNSLSRNLPYKNLFVELKKIFDRIEF